MPDPGKCFTMSTSDLNTFDRHLCQHSTFKPTGSTVLLLIAVVIRPEKLLTTTTATIVTPKYLIIDAIIYSVTATNGTIYFYVSQDFDSD